jgi:phosphate starvation-inducible membrane PsiE
MKLCASHLRLLQEARERVDVSFVANFVVIFVFLANSNDFLDDFSQKGFHPGHPLIQGILLFFFYFSMHVII